MRHFYEKIYQELGLRLLELQIWYRKLGMLCKIFKSKSPQYLFKLMPENTHAYVTKNVNNILFLNTRHNFLIGIAT